MIPKSVVGRLTEDSSNIIGLIQDAYNDLKGQVCLIRNFYILRCICISSYQEKAIKAYLEVSGHCLTTPRRGEIPLRAFPNVTTSKFAGLVTTLSLLL